jgi:hypothetical protein
MSRRHESVLKDWLAAVNKRDLKRLLALYNERAILIPTFSNRLLDSPPRIREYFRKLASHKELSVSLHEKTLLVQPISGRLYALSGIYCWRIALDTEPLRFEARFSYLLDLAKPRPILHHHSSQIPRTL